MALVLEGTSIGLDQKTVLKGELLIWRTKNQARDQGIVHLKDPICFKSGQIGSQEIEPWTIVSSGPKLEGLWARVNQYPHQYLHLLELGLLVAIFNPGNVKLGLRDLDLVVGWDTYNGQKE